MANHQNIADHQGQGPAVSSQVDSDKLLSALSYVGLLVLVPLILNQEKKDEFIKYHTKQGLVLAGIGLLTVAFRWMVPSGAFFYYGIGAGYLLWAFVGLLLTAVQFAIFVLAVIGIMHAVQNEKKPLPLVGTFAEKLKI